MDDYSKIFDLSGRRALVIGGASGIGRASCFGLASFGAHVICGDVETAKAKDAALAIAAHGRGDIALQFRACADGADHRVRRRARFAERRSAQAFSAYRLHRRLQHVRAAGGDSQLRFRR